MICNPIYFQQTNVLLLLYFTVDLQTPELGNIIVLTLVRFQKTTEKWTQDFKGTEYLFIFCKARLEEAIWSHFQTEGFILLSLKYTLGTGELHQKKSMSIDQAVIHLSTWNALNRSYRDRNRDSQSFLQKAGSSPPVKTMQESKD